MPPPMHLSSINLKKLHIKIENFFNKIKHYRILLRLNFIFQTLIVNSILSIPYQSYNAIDNNIIYFRLPHQ